MSRALRRFLSAPPREPSMTAMIDVVFLLLIFFMCATKFLEPEGVLRTFMPRDAGPSSDPERSFPRCCRVFLTLDDAGELFVLADERRIPSNTWGDYERWSGKPGLDVDELERHLTRRLETHNGVEPLAVVIDFSAEVPSIYVVQVLNACRKIGIDDVRMAIPEAS